VRRIEEKGAGMTQLKEIGGKVWKCCLDERFKNGTESDRNKIAKAAA